MMSLNVTSKAVDLEADSGVDVQRFLDSLDLDGDPIVESLRRAKLVPLTDKERALLAEMETRPACWMSDGAFAELCNRDV